MTDLAPFGGQAATMTTIELRDMVNEACSAAGEPKIRNDQFLARVEDELGDELEGVQKYYTPFHGNQVATYDLTLDQCMLVGMRESKSVRRSVLAKLKSRRPPMTQAEHLLAHAQLQVQLERRQRQTEQQVAALTETVGDMDRSHPLLDSIPNGMESITAIRQRIGKQYGLPPRVIDAVVRDMPHSPRPFAMVRSKHEELNARPYAVWAKAEISRVFERFARGCTFVTQHRATHPDFGAGRERFQMRGTPTQEIGE
ncbi:TPA: hypothetical protein ACKQBE_005951 [Pseudomonas aeruginosa]